MNFWYAPRHHFVIQLIGGANKKQIENFIATNKKHTRLSYFNTIKNNKNWYAVVQGTYKTYGEAEKQLKALPKNLSKHGPWIRKYHSIQKEISANAEKIIMLSNSFANVE